METQYRSTTKNDISSYKAICQTLITKTQIENDYNTLKILFIDNNSLLEVFQKEITQATGGHFQGKMPAQARAYVSQQGKAAIAINTTGLGSKTEEYCEFIILEEFCRLIDYAAADSTQNDQFLNFRKEYSRYVESHFATEIADGLNANYNQYYVNKLMLSFDPEKWIEFKSDLYGPSYKAKLSSRLSAIRATRPPKHCLAIITSEILRMHCFARAIESFLVHAELPETQIQQLNASKNSVIETIRFAEQNARAIDNAYPDTVDYFQRSDFVSKNSFFVRIRQFFNFLHLFG
jgi:hypothetical protein